MEKRRLLKTNLGIIRPENIPHVRLEPIYYQNIKVMVCAFCIALICWFSCDKPSSIYHERTTLVPIIKKEQIGMIDKVKMNVKFIYFKTKTSFKPLKELIIFDYDVSKDPIHVNINKWIDLGLVQIADKELIIQLPKEIRISILAVISDNIGMNNLKNIVMVLTDEKNKIKYESQLSPITHNLFHFAKAKAVMKKKTLAQNKHTQEIQLMSLLGHSWK